MENQIKLSRGNSKIYKALIWNLPSGVTCPGSTEMCSKICYARDAEVFRVNTVPPARERNLRISKREDFKDLMSAKIKRSRIKLFRIHESGDFYSQKYLDDWVAIMKENPDNIFWAYTKSWNLDFTEALKLPNFFLRYSVDATTKHYPKLSIPHAAVSAVRSDFFVCPSTLVKGHKIQCMKDCSFCIENREPLTFRPHGSRSGRVSEIENKKGTK